jgi:hypothetical protein
MASLNKTTPLDPFCSSKIIMTTYSHLIKIIHILDILDDMEK